MYQFLNFNFKIKVSATTLDFTKSIKISRKKIKIVEIKDKKSINFRQLTPIC